MANGVGAGNEAGSTFTIRIRGANDAPTATSDGAAIVLDARAAQVAGPVERGGTVADNVADPDAGQTALLNVFRASAQGTPTAKLVFGASGEAAVAGTYGTLFLQANGAWRYALDLADPDTLALGAGASVTDAFAYTVVNGPIAANNTSPGNEATAGITIGIRLPDVLPDAVGTAGTDRLVGNAGANLLLGLGGADTLLGGAGRDSMVGGEGDDAYVVERGDDVAVELAGDGTDTVFTSVSFTLAAELEKLVLTGAAAINGGGNGLGNSFTGNAAANALFGEGGDDTLSGSAGADTLSGGGGRDSFRAVGRTEERRARREGRHRQEGGAAAA